MDLRVYYQKIREAEARIGEADAVVVSLETSNGGRGGVTTEAPRAIAAKLIVDGRARLATTEEADQFRERAAEAKKVADQTAAANRVQVTVISDADLRALRSVQRAKN